MMEIDRVIPTQEETKNLHWNKFLNYTFFVEFLHKLNVLYV